MAKDSEQYRLSAILRGAFAGPATPLKNIQKRNGESRASSRLMRRAAANSSS